MSSPSWVTAFLDLPADRFDRGVEFWQAVTGYALSERRRDDAEFATLIPPGGDAYLRVQRVDDGGAGLHLDLHVDNPTISAEAANELGGQVLVRHEQGYVVMRSPGGFRFCLVPGAAAARPRPATWAGGRRSMVDQVCLDMPPERYDEEVAFWQALTGWELKPSASPEFARLEPPESMPLRWLLQRLDDRGGVVSAHFDVAADDREAETARHEALGATVVRHHDWWTVLTDPAGMTYCITDRTP